MARTKYLRLSVYVFLVALPRCVFCQELPDHSKRIVIKSGTAVKLQFAKTVCSARARAKDTLDFVVEKDVIADGFTVIPSGATAHGSVTDVKTKRMLGIGGKVTVKLDSVELPTGES